MGTRDENGEVLALALLVPWVLAHDTIHAFASHMLAKGATFFDGGADFHD